MTERRSVRGFYGLAAAVVLAACGPETVPAGASSGGNSTSAPSTGEAESASESTGLPANCNGVAVGELSDNRIVRVDDTTDLDWLASLREVQGTLVVSNLQGSVQLEELSCLQEVSGSLAIQGNPNLVSLHGLRHFRGSSFRELNSLSISDNPKLETLAGLEAMEEIGVIKVVGNPSLERLELHNVKVLSSLQLGDLYCETTPPGQPRFEPMPSGDNPLLTEIDGLELLETATDFDIYAQSGFNSTDRIEELAAKYLEENGTLRGRISGIFKFNPSLPESEVASMMAAAGWDTYSETSACENRDDDRECTCPVGS